MERFKTALWSSSPTYNALRTSQSDDGEQQEGEERLRAELAVLEGNIWCLRASLFITGAALLLVIIFAVCAAQAILEVIQTGLFLLVSRFGVENSKRIMSDLRWQKSTSPYYIEENTFHDLSKTKAVIKHLKSIHNSSNVLVNGHFADWKRPDGTVAKLPAYYSTVSFRQTYIIRSFHQMHCLISIAEEYGHRVHNVSSQWPPEHVAHCLNAIREAIQCLADATPMTYVNGFAVGHVTDDQQFKCRDWSALRRWANDPIRGIRYKNLAPEGAKYDNYTEIIPFPELSEMEKVGLA
ncbi:hypothetical protein CCHL11_02354 [Colletotrichum chlorophyti]|uniref:Cyclochlorotine biosynthesis protein R n=1 Tax=Colletotrichum chlorophyti TaxID=708187 RepID=A0A1Q8S611_9PEZI|nr:hypothetical protein CCHL11_02354 [Colletotrichum chlorophyti]